jgi:CBS domain-containing protein
MLLKDIYTPDAVCCGPQTHALDAARLMRHKHVGDLVVVDDPNDARTPLGVVTDRDLVVEVLGNGLDPATTTLASLMHTPVVIAKETDDTSQVIERMRMHGVRRVPVVNDQGAVVGIITLADLLRAFVTDANALLDVVAKGQQHERRSRR